MRFHEVLCYPLPDPECVRERMEELSSCGVMELLKEGKKHISDWAVLGKGHSSIVLKALLRGGGVAAVKVLRRDSKRDDLYLECLFLNRGQPITPKPLCCRKDLIVMEFVGGRPLKEVLKRDKMSCQKALPIVLKVFEAVNWLDRAGIDHKELSRPEKHVFITSEGTVKILDLESASGGPSRNLLRVFSWFIMRSWFGNECCAKDLIKEALPLLRSYKGTPRKVFKDLVRLVIKECSSH